MKTTAGNVQPGDLIDDTFVVSVDGPFYNETAITQSTKSPTKRKPMDKAAYVALCEEEVDSQYALEPATIRIMLANSRSLVRRVDEEITVWRLIAA